MTPAEHYAEADRLIGTVGELSGRRVARAQVHATLATCPVFFPEPHGLTDKEVFVLKDAVASVQSTRPAGSTRVALLESAMSKLGIITYTGKANV